MQPLSSTTERTLSLAALVLGGVLVLSAVAPAPASPSPMPASAAAATDTDLLTAMEGLKTHMKATAMALQGNSTEEALEHIAEMQRLVLLAKLESPPNLEELAKKERAAHQMAFRKDLIGVLKEFADMEIDVLEGRFEAAFARVVDPLHPTREAAHAKYQK